MSDQTEDANAESVSRSASCAQAKEIEAVTSKLNPYFNGDPDYVNDKGVKWWLNEDYTDQANPGLEGTCWEVELPSGDRELIFVAPSGAVLKSTTKPPTMHDWVKMQKLAEGKV